MPVNMGAFEAPAEATPDVPAEPVKKPRRTKAQMIADAVIPGNDDAVEIKLKDTDAKVERPWTVALELVRDSKAEFVNRDHKYAMLKWDEQKAAGENPALSPTNAFDESSVPVEQAEDKMKTLLGDDVAALTKRWEGIQEQLDEIKVGEDEKEAALNEESELIQKRIAELGAPDPSSDESYAERSGIAALGNTGTGQFKAPDEASVGDYVEIGDQTYRVAHGNSLIAGDKPISVDGQIVDGDSRWEWDESAKQWAKYDRKKERLAAQQQEPGFHDPAKQQGNPGGFEQAAAETATKLSQEQAETLPSVSAGQHGITSVREVVGEAIEVANADIGIYKVSGGYLEKIGLPDYSSLQIGPTTVQRYVRDDGRRTEVEMGGRKVKLPTAVIEAQAECFQVSEYSMRAERQAAINFLEAVKPGSTQGGAA